MEGIRPPASGYIRVNTKNIIELLYIPVTLGHWKQHELWDGTYTLDDLFDLIEALAVNQENKLRAQEFAEIIQGG